MLYLCAHHNPAEAADDAGAAAQGLARGLVGHWTFDEGAGTIAREVSGRGNHGTIHGATFVKRGDGFALRLDGKDDYVEIPAGSTARKFSGMVEEVPPWFLTLVSAKP